MARTVKKKKELTIEEKLEQALVPVEEQPYQVPENWCWIRFGEITINYDKKRIPLSAKQRSLLDKVYDYYGASGIIDKVDKYIFDQELLLIGEDGANLLYRSTDIAFLASGKYWVNNHAHIVDTLICSRQYMKYYINSIDLSPFITGTAQPKLTQDNMNSIPIPIPPAQEQQRIVDRIESLFAKLDEAKEKAQAVVDGFEDRKAAILHKAFTGELTAGWRDTHGLSMDEWEHAPLNTVFQLRSGSTIDISEEREYGAIPYVKVADMNLPENEIQITTSSRFVDSCPESHVIPEGSTIFPKRGGAILTNKKRYVGINKIIADLNTMAIMPIEGKAYGWYGYYWMQSVDLRQLNNGSNVPQINNKDMVKLFVPKPSIIEQKIIVSILDSVFGKEQQAKEAAEQVISQIDIMKKSILARAFRGELGTNDSADESAIELLKRVL